MIDSRSVSDSESCPSESQIVAFDKELAHACIAGYVDS